MARMADCAACHMGNDGTPFGGGHVIESPLGSIVAPNITPSRQFGIGNWTEAQFARAVRRGLSPDGHLYPAMPYPAYAGLSDEDIHALYVYLKWSIVPVEHGPSVETALPFPFNLRTLMVGWNALYARGKPMKHADTASGGSKRGEYLVTVTGHCGSCHTPRNILLGEDQSRQLAGASVGGWFAPNITSDPISGIGGWSEDELVIYFRTGAVVGKSHAAGGMADAIEHGLSHLDDDDLHAIARHLKNVPPIRDANTTQPAYGVASARPAPPEPVDLGVRTPDSLTDATDTDGARLYTAACAACHQANGEGTADQFYPSLYANTATGGPNPQNLVMAIVKGVRRSTHSGFASMPSFEHELTDDQIAAVSNYVLNRFGNASLSVSASDVSAIKAGGEKPLLLRLMGRLDIAAMAGALGFGGLAGGAAILRRKERIKAQFAPSPEHLPEQGEHLTPR
ncbi:cytochrome c [Gluconacetobacter tumulicola]